MYNKRLFLSIIGLLGLLTMSVIPTLGQDMPWFAYLYNGRDLIRVRQDGGQEAFNLGLGDNVFVGAREMAFNADGSRAAFCATSYPPAVDGQASLPSWIRIYLRDIAAQSTLLAADTGSAIACRVGENGLSPNGALIAVGVINALPGSTPCVPRSTQLTYRTRACRAAQTTYRLYMFSLRLYTVSGPDVFRAGLIIRNPPPIEKPNHSYWIGKQRKK